MALFPYIKGRVKLMYLFNKFFFFYIYIINRIRLPKSPNPIKNVSHPNLPLFNCSQVRDPLFALYLNSRELAAVFLYRSP